MILQAINLSKNYNGLTALSNVNMAVAPGEIFGIAGPNGAGKSTMFNVIAGAYPASGGKIIFNDHDITHLKSHRICQLGLARTFQIPQSFSTLSVYDNLRVGAIFGQTPRLKSKSSAVYREKIEEMLEFLDLKPYRHSLAANLDIYTTKLVMLGSALATGCRVIMLDEPLAGLSMAEIKDFLKLINTINKQMQITVVVIEHLLDMLIEISSKILILHNGSVIYDGLPDGVRKNEDVVKVYLGEEKD